MAHPPRLTRSSSRCPRLGHWGICGTQQGREGTGSRTTNSFSLGVFFRCDLTNTQYPNLPQHRLALHLTGTVTGHSRDASIFNGNVQAWETRPHTPCSLPAQTCGTPSPREACDVVGSSRLSSTQLSAALPGCHGLLSGHCSLQVFALLFEKLGFF